MTEKYDKLNETFNIQNSLENSSDINEIKTIDVIQTSEVANVDQNSNEKSKDVLRDYEYTRGNLYSIIEKGQEALSGILELAQESGMPRAYEVAGQLIKNVSDATDKLMDLQKKLKDIEDTSIKGPTNVTNALFVGSTAELSKLLKSNIQQQNKEDKKQ